jgi:hypothetical protein
VQRPRAKEGGREEEEKRSGISVGSSDGLHSNKHIGCTALAHSRDPAQPTQTPWWRMRNCTCDSMSCSEFRCVSALSISNPARCVEHKLGPQGGGVPARYTHEAASLRNNFRTFSPALAQAVSPGFAPATVNAREAALPWWTRAMPADTPMSAVTSRVVSGSAISATPANRPNIGVNSVRADS